MQTTIAGKQVPVEDGPRTVVYFKAGCNPADAPGYYLFWTMKNERGMRHCGRRPAGRDPGERFQMMEHDARYAAAWADAQTAIIVRPTSADELIAWLNNHPEDALCAGRCIVRGEPMIVVERNGQYDLKAMRSSIELGAVFQHNGDERPIRVIAFDDKVVMYDAWSHRNSWGMSKLTGRFFYYRMNRDFFEAGARYLRTDTYTEEEHNVHRPDLPFAFAHHDSLSWYTQQPNSETELERQLSDARVPEQKHKASARLTTPAIYLAPYGPKGMSKPTTLITAQDGESFTEVEMLWHAWQLQAPYLREQQIAKGIGIHRLGIQRRKPSYYIWGAKSKLEMPPP